MTLDFQTKRAAREAILKLVYQKAEAQEHRYDDVRLLSALDQLAFVLYRDVIHELLQDLSDRGYIAYQQDRKLFRKKGELSIHSIQLTPRGRDIVEGIERDPAIGVE